MPHEVRLPPHPASVGRARRFVLDELRTMGIADPNAAAELVVSELVTNAVMHAGTPITVRVERWGAGARVEVADGSHSMPGLRAVSVASSSGRGLTLVEHFATAWGADRTDDGKVVWFLVGDPAKAAG
ncbi:MAG TPA: ATP-binding protein [Mycobacteriales bacterium]|nr:ATP-binding protein [Mycobacteriales bacterium]